MFTNWTTLIPFCFCYVVQRGDFGGKPKLMWYQEADRHMKAAKTERIGMITYPGRSYESLLRCCLLSVRLRLYILLAIGAGLHRRSALKKAAHHCYPIVMKHAVLVLAA